MVDKKHIDNYIKQIREPTVSNPVEAVVMLPLRMTEKELDERINKIPNTQKKLACNSNFYFTGWDAAKALPTIKATVLELGLIEII